MSTLDQAVKIAISAHECLPHRSGKPSVFLSIQVMNRVSDELEKMTAVLYEAVEVNIITVDFLAQNGFPSQVIQAILALKKNLDETLLDQTLRAAADPIARVVMLAQINERMNMSRIPFPTEKDYAQRRESERVRALLQAACSMSQSS